MSVLIYEFNIGSAARDIFYDVLGAMTGKKKGKEDMSGSCYSVDLVLDGVVLDQIGEVTGNGITENIALLKSKTEDIYVKLMRIDTRLYCFAVDSLGNRTKYGYIDYYPEEGSLLIVDVGGFIGIYISEKLIVLNFRKRSLDEYNAESLVGDDGVFYRRLVFVSSYKQLNFLSTDDFMPVVSGHITIGTYNDREELDAKTRLVKQHKELIYGYERKIDDEMVWVEESETVYLQLALEGMDFTDLSAANFPSGLDYKMTYNNEEYVPFTDLYVRIDDSNANLCFTEGCLSTSSGFYLGPSTCLKQHALVTDMNTGNQYITILMSNIVLAFPEPYVLAFLIPYR